jgi:DNA-directed RNA polymerase
MVAIASAYGFDKRPYDEMRNWTYEHFDEIFESQKDPDTCDFWRGADKPQPFLTLCREFAEMRSGGVNYLTHQPIMLDASCSGIQHLCLLSGDMETGEMVNLLPSDGPKDFYKWIMLFLIEKNDEVIKAGPPEPVSKHHPRKDVYKKYKEDLFKFECAKAWKGKINRKIVKRPAMTFSYGSTMQGHAEHIEEELYKKDGELGSDYITGVSNHDLAKYLSQHTYNVLKKKAKGPYEVMKYIRSVAKICADNGKALQWLTPLGVPIRQLNHETKGYRVKRLWGEDNQRVELTYRRNLPELDPYDMMDGAPPNYTHGMDASHLVLTLLECKRRGIQSTISIHDSIGVHAAHVDALQEIFWSELVKLYSVNRLDLFRKEASAFSGLDLPEFEGYTEPEFGRFSEYSFGI